MDNRFLLGADFYKSNSDGLLLDVPVPSTSGFTEVFRNIGALQTKGLELGILTSHNFQNNVPNGIYSLSYRMR